MRIVPLSYILFLQGKKVNKEKSLFFFFELKNNRYICSILPFCFDKTGKW